MDKREKKIVDPEIKKMKKAAKESLSKEDYEKFCICVSKIERKCEVFYYQCNDNQFNAAFSSTSVIEEEFKNALSIYKCEELEEKHKYFLDTKKKYENLFEKVCLEHKAMKPYIKHYSKKWFREENYNNIDEEDSEDYDLFTNNIKIDEEDNSINNCSEFILDHGDEEYIDIALDLLMYKEGYKSIPKEKKRRKEKVKINKFFFTHCSFPLILKDRRNIK